jgi:hypothetical protein
MFIIMDNNDLGFIKISLNTFKEHYNKTYDFSNETLQKKANELISNYNCFVSNYDAKSLWEKKKIMANQKKVIKNNNSNTRTRPFVVLIDLNDEMKYKKEFTSYLNKLTDINKTVIYNKIKEFIRTINETKINALFDILINFIKISSNNIYIDVLYLFPDNYIDYHINNYCFSYINNKEWFVSEDFLINNKILYNNDNYDNYCKFVKYKKQTLSILKALLNINKKLNRPDFSISLNIDILKMIDIYIDNNNYKHIVEFLLDEISIIYENNKDSKIIDNLNKYNLNNLDNSTKFKIMKILDSIKK